MQEYEYLDSGGRVICRLHDRLRCDECFYVTELQEQNKRYREALEFIGNHANESDMMDNVMYTELVKEVIEKALEE